MIQKYMEDLKNEITTIKNDFLNNDNVTFVYGRTGNFLGLTYRVILKNGTEFYIGTDTYTLPPFDVNDIVYIRKGLQEDIGNFYHYFDTEVGEYYMKDSYYDRLISNLFNVQDIFETGCYEEG